MHTHHLTGCAPTPLAGYLKALGIFRILSEQRPATNPRARWDGNTFIIETTDDADALIKFFLNDYRPSPVVAPWNGGSGFFPKDNSKAIDAIGASKPERFSLYRETIDSAKKILSAMNLREKPEAGGPKETLLQRCRNSFPESALDWLDAAYVLTDDGAKYPPLLGTGGNDGRLEFTNNFMQRLTEIFDFSTGTAQKSAGEFLAGALFDSPVRGLADNPIGQFSPAAAGGANATTGFDAKSAVNPWDFIFALEGALLFAAATVKRLEGTAPGQLVYPFCVQAAGVGYGSAATADESDARCEIWMPLWQNATTLPELKNLFSEGRAWVGRRSAKNGVDFSLAVASLGTDRGIGEFQRFAFYVRNGLAYFATPLQRVKVSRSEVVVDLIAACDGWLQRFAHRAKADTAPGSVRRAARRLENAILAQTASAQENNPVLTQELLIAFGECERAIAGSEKWRTESFIPPIPPLPRAWIKAADTGTVEFRLAASVASLSLYAKNNFFPIRRHLEPVKVSYGENSWANWDDSAKNDVVSDAGGAVDLLCAIMRRRLLLAQKNSSESWPEYAKISAYPSDIAAFVAGQIDDDLFVQLLRGLSLIDFFGESKGNMPAVPKKYYERGNPGSDFSNHEAPPAFYAQLKLCFATHLPEEKQIPVEPIIFNLAAGGDGERASRQALRRLHGSSVPVTHIEISVAGEAAKRTAAALLFPLWEDQLSEVGKIVAPDFFR